MKSQFNVFYFDCFAIVGDLQSPFVKNGPSADTYDASKRIFMDR